MQYWRCKCGKREVYESGMSPQACEVCSVCGSTFSQSPSTHPEPIPHDWITKYDQDTGKPFKMCRRCGYSERTIKYLTDQTRNKIVTGSEISERN
jgi:hypothetical protein